MTEHFVNPKHAFDTGMLLGTLMNHGVEVESEVEGKDYTSYLRITLDNEKTVVIKVIGTHSD